MNPPVKSPEFIGYPRAVEAPDTQYNKAEDSNPVIRGLVLVIGAWLVSKFEILQKYLWANAGFNSLRALKHVNGYTERWDPTVIPFRNAPLLEVGRLEPESFPVSEYPLRYYTIAEYHACYLSGELTPLMVAESLLPLIRRDVTPASHHATAFIASNVERIIAAAQASTLRYKCAKPLSIMDGVPTGIKDESNVIGYRTTCGRRANHDLYPVVDKSSWSAHQLEEAGALILGKLNMHELGADTTNNNPNYGTPLNPHNSSYYTGGSSGGAAYVVAAGLAPFALGADGGGSIRIPASFCGVYGLKPSHGRLEDTGSTVTVTGPIAATMADLEIAYRIMSVPDPEDPISSLFAPSINPPSTSKTIGIYKPWFERAEPKVLALCNAALDQYQSIGYKIVNITLPYIPQGQLAHAITILSEISLRERSAALPRTRNYLAGLNPANKILLAVGAQTPAQDYLSAQQLRNMLMQHLSFLYQKYPGLLIVTPTSPMAGWPISSIEDLKYGICDGNSSVRSMEYVWMANFCGNPAITCPIGYAEPVKGHGNVPVGIMAMGEWGSEELLFKWGRECEKFLHSSRASRPRPLNWVDVIGNAGKGMSACEEKKIS